MYVTASVEAFCDALFNVVVRNLYDEASSSDRVGPLVTTISVSHIQEALRSHTELAQLLRNVPSLAILLEFFMDDATSKELYARRLISTREAPHLRNASHRQLPMDDSMPSEAELIQHHDRTRAEWQKREDDPFNEVDFAMVLKCVHPAFTLSYPATTMLSAVVRELLNEVCELAQIDVVQQRLPPELYLEDIETPIVQVFHVGDALGKQIARTALDCLERFRLQSRKGTTLTLRFRLFASTSGAAAKQQGFRAAPQLCLSNVSRETPMGQLAVQMCKRCRQDPALSVVIYRGHQVDPQATPVSLSMPTGAIVYLVAKKWWDHTRRNEARRGLLSSIRPQDALVKSLVEGSESKVKNKFPVGAIVARSPTIAVDIGGSLSALRHDDSGARPLRSNNSHTNSNSSLPGGHSPGGRRQPSRTTDKAPPPVAASHHNHLRPEDESPALLNEPDSLSLLVIERGTKKQQQQRIRVRHNGAMMASNATAGMHVRDNNKTSDTDAEDSLSERHPPPGRHPLRPSNIAMSSLSLSSASPVQLGARFAHTGIQLRTLLDEAWLGFAGLSSGVRTMTEQIAGWQTSEQSGSSSSSPILAAKARSSPSPYLMDLEADLVQRLAQTEQLVAQTTAARELVEQLLHATRYINKASD